MRRILLLALFCALAAPGRAHAWGADGHRIACGIAWQRLKPATRALVTRLLAGSDEKSFVDACLWADVVRPQRPETYAYHFINIATGETGMDMARDCGDKSKRCAPWAIAHFGRILADSSAAEAQRVEALKFVLHFVGDIHQPLHAGRPEDRGGNDITVTFFGNAGTVDHPMNLHSVWDSQLLRRAKDGVWPALSLRLNGEIKPADAAAWETLDIVAWTNESYRMCEDLVYGELPADRGIEAAYFKSALAAAEARLQMAGVRLAYLLNQATIGIAPDAI